MRASLVLAVAAAAAPLGTAAEASPYAHTGRDLAAACAICHGTNGASVGDLPRLAGRPADYLARQLRDFRDGRRPATLMHQISRGLTEAQIDAVAAFYAAQKAR